MDKIDQLVEIGNILGEWAFLVGIHENPKTREFIEDVLEMLSKRDQSGLEEIKTRLLKQKEAKALQLSISGLMEKNNSE